MPLSAQQLAAQKNLSYVLAEKLAQRILKVNMNPAPFCLVRLSWASNLSESYSGTRSGQNVNGKRDGFTATANWYPSHATIELEFS